jgi:hypothetical protein
MVHQVTVIREAKELRDNMKIAIEAYNEKYDWLYISLIEDE